MAQKSSSAAPIQLLPDWPSIPTLDPEEFAMAVRAGNAAARFQTPKSIFERYCFLLENDEHDSAEGFENDTSSARFNVALLECFKGHPVKVLSARIRWFALVHLLKEPESAKWTKPCEEDPRQVLISESMLFAAADCLINKDGAFEKSAFLRRLQEVEKDTNAGTDRRD